jgi:hybrid polyketide synthase/nonribosomal peptide synthetase ACE1
MPSHVAQAELIRETYAKAGLDITKVEERPQFFEAHGTGKPYLLFDPAARESVLTELRYTSR